MSNPETKVCSRCKEEKVLNLFYSNKSRKDGKSAYCIACQKYHTEMQRSNNPGIFSKKQKDRAKIYRDKNREKHILSVIRCRKRHAETISDFYLSKMLSVPEDCIELKRAQIQILRATKELVETIKEKQK